MEPLVIFLYRQLSHWMLTASLECCWAPVSCFSVGRAGMWKGPHESQGLGDLASVPSPPWQDWVQFKARTFWPWPGWELIPVSPPDQGA